MKKVLSLVLAFVLMFTICVPAFAATLDSANKTGTVPVRVDGTIVGASFTVTIPATASISWEQTEKAVEYSVFSQLETGKGIKITVSGDIDGKMKNAAKTAFLEYSLKSGTTEYVTTKSVIPSSNPEESSVVVQIPTENWKKASIDKYVGTLTFNAELADI